MSGDAFDPERFPDNFYRGVIVRLNRASLKGLVRSDSGREIPFQFPFVAVVGAPLGGRAPGIEMLHVGVRDRLRRRLDFQGTGGHQDQAAMNQGSRGEARR